MWRIVRRVLCFVKDILEISQCQLENALAQAVSQWQLENALRFLAEGIRPISRNFHRNSASCEHGRIPVKISAGTAHLDHVVPTVFALHQIGDGIAVKKLIDRFIEPVPHRQSPAVGGHGTRFGIRFQTGNRSQRTLCQAQDLAHFIIFRGAGQAVSAAFSLCTSTKPDLDRLDMIDSRYFWEISCRSATSFNGVKAPVACSARSTMTRSAYLPLVEIIIIPKPSFSIFSFTVSQAVLRITNHRLQNLLS